MTKQEAIDWAVNVLVTVEVVVGKYQASSIP